MNWPRLSVLKAAANQAIQKTRIVHVAAFVLILTKHEWLGSFAIQHMVFCEAVGSWGRTGIRCSPSSGNCSLPAAASPPSPTPPESPNCTPHARRLIKSIRHECLDDLIVFDDPPLRHLVHEYVAH